MDPFTERILERARERQKKLLEYSGGQPITPLKESNMKSESAPTISSLEQNITELKNSKRKEVVSDSNLCAKAAADNFTLTPTASCEENVRVEVQFEEEHSDDEKENLAYDCEQIQGGDIEGDQPVLREDAKKRLQRLGKLYAGGDDAEISSPIHRTEPTFLAESSRSEETRQVRDNKNNETEKNIARGRKGLGGLAALVENINQWEEDTVTTKKDTSEIKPSSVPKRSWKPPAPRPPISSIRSSDNVPTRSSSSRPVKAQAPKPPTDVCQKTSVEAETVTTTVSSPTKQISVDSVRDTPKQLNLDPVLLKTLESQGFTRTTSNTRLIYNYDSQNSPNKIKTAEISSPSKLTSNMRKDCIIEETEPEEPDTQITETASQTSFNKLENRSTIQTAPRSPTKSNVKGTAIANRAAIFESASSPNNNKNNTKDPALLSVSERKALFEKNKGTAPVPKAPISMATPVNAEKVVPKNQKDSGKPVSGTNSRTTSPTKGECGIVVNTTKAKLPVSRPPIRPNDNVNSASYRVAPGQPGGIASKMAALFQNKSTISQQQIETSIREQRQKEMDVLLNRFQKNRQAVQDDAYESESDNEEVTETTAMITEKPAQIIKKFEQIPPPPPPPGPSENKRRSGGKRCSKEDSPKVAAVLEDVKRIKVIPSKPGNLYPCLSDIETATETETENATSPTPNNSSYEEYYSGSDEDVGDTSFEREILQTVCKNQVPQKRPIIDESTESDISDILDEKDDYIDEALAYDPININGPTPPKYGRSASPVNNSAQPSNSFQYKNYSPHKGSPQKNNSPKKDFTTPSKAYLPRKSEELPTYVVDGDKELPLTHTVSFYRRQQTQETKTPVRQIIHQPVIEESSESTMSSSDSINCEVKHKIKELLEEMTKQQTIISQTSQALNLCYSTPEFTGSTEQVEFERVLLLATHKRAAAQREMERLTVLKTLQPENGSLEKGTLTISNIVLPLKRDYVRALNATGGKGHHVVCLIKCADQVFSTKLVSTVATNDRNPNLELDIPGTIRLDNVYSNFTVQFEVYCLQAQEEILPHEVKYHINKKASAKMTPKKGKSDSRLIRPPKESPGGPQAVRSPTFALMGYVVFSIQHVNRKNWTLNNAPSMCPLEGIVEMRVKSEFKVSVEYHGFLTMFEDVSGFGAWHRRWCLLKGHALSYWKYPDDEKKKAPIDTIDLTSCMTQHVDLVRRDICARPNTLLITTTRIAQPYDKDSLIMQCSGNTTIIRHLLSADTKEERIEWCTMLNKALAGAKINQNSK